MSNTTVNIVVPKQNPQTRRFRFRRPSIGITLAVLWLLIVVISAIFAPLLAPYPPLQNDLIATSEGPSFAHLLGTDQLGRDTLSRLMYGGGPTLAAVAVSVLVYVTLGLVFGLIAGYAGGWTDRISMAVVAIVIALPNIIVLFVLLSIYRGNTMVAMAVFGALAAPVLVILVRASTISVRHELFVDAARVSGLNPAYIVFSHVLPRARGVIIVQGAVFAATALIVESSLSFLGFGVQAPDPSWGNMIAAAAQVIASYPWMLWAPGLAIALTALAFGVIGDSVRDVSAFGWGQSKLTKSPAHAKVPAREKDHDPGALLSVHYLHVGYRSGDEIIPIVREVSFDIGRGQIVGVAGESGSGKTTVAFGILGVVGEGAVVTAGSVRFDGTELIGQTEAVLSKFRGKRIAYVAQEPMVALGPSHRVGKQLYEAVRLNDGLTGEAAWNRVHELLAQTDLPNPEVVARKYLHELSGGMAQRVSIAFALAGRPELLVADEPTTALDVTVQAGILGLLRKLRDETGMSILIITHDWGVIADLCDRVVVMYKGEIVEQGDVEQIFSAPAHDYTAALLTSNPHGAEPGRDLPVITGSFITPIMARELAEDVALDVKEEVR
ncbi:dipeptide/oligopeptide/nickel ABC transporter permease/ATP-binding protein [Microbacterium sp. ET2]|uniref:dipeptide/oligopeptide/nickel ABC transporter permease/ATP-binding protein n=1 Tax=Microbacterium albipurpureum TaxID=3050384 RepID=UPI00259CCFA1|nr:dipeptide/oligopeptide/nickel ABC transporter permease/ATP-binding protein [Microbacterium sp. ET2 (Ac-2212)]WJL96762.1 dipeptide/oligopeptide/nickel ABC transporter permease/ATP-binding protein [Microbacterium sp. ET2 (Ac-2212)]